MSRKNRKPGWYPPNLKLPPVDQQVVVFGPDLDQNNVEGNIVDLATWDGSGWHTDCFQLKIEYWTEKPT